MLRDKSTPVTVKEETIDDAILAAEILRNGPRIDAEGGDSPERTETCRETAQTARKTKCA